MYRSEQKPRARTVQMAGFLAVVFGFLGVFAGISGALTFVPYREQAHHSFETAQLLAAISAAGAAASMVGLVAGLWLRRGKAWARRAAMAAAAACVATVGVFAAAMPPTTPSPVPGGPSVLVFFGAVAGAYALEAALLFVGLRRPRRAAAL